MDAIFFSQELSLAAIKGEMAPVGDGEKCAKSQAGSVGEKDMSPEDDRVASADAERLSVTKSLKVIQSFSVVFAIEWFIVWHSRTGTSLELCP